MTVFSLAHIPGGDSKLVVFQSEEPELNSSHMQYVRQKLRFSSENTRYNLKDVDIGEKGGLHFPDNHTHYAVTEAEYRRKYEKLGMEVPSVADQSDIGSVASAPHKPLQWQQRSYGDYTTHTQAHPKAGHETDTTPHPGLVSMSRRLIVIDSQAPTPTKAEIDEAIETYRIKGKIVKSSLDNVSIGVKNQLCFLDKANYVVTQAEYERRYQAEGMIAPSVMEQTRLYTTGHSQMRPDDPKWLEFVASLPPDSFKFSEDGTRITTEDCKTEQKHPHRPYRPILEPVKTPAELSHELGARCSHLIQRPKYLSHFEMLAGRSVPLLGNIRVPEGIKDALKAYRKQEPPLLTSAMAEEINRHIAVRAYKGRKKSKGSKPIGFNYPAIAERYFEGDTSIPQAELAARVLIDIEELNVLLKAKTDYFIMMERYWKHETTPEELAALKIVWPI